MIQRWNKDDWVILILSRLALRFARGSIFFFLNRDRYCLLEIFMTKVDTFFKE